MPTVTSVRSAAPAAGAVLPLSTFSPTRLVTLRDGGTMICDGMLNRSFTAKVRLDGGIDSGTRGEFFVARKHFAKPAEAEKKMTLDELRGFREAIRRHMANTPGRQPDYERLGKRVDEAIARKAPGPASVAKLPTSITGPNASASVAASLWVNLMPGPGSSARPIYGRVTVSGTGFNDAPPNFKAARLEVYQKGSNKPAFSVDAPKVQESEVRRGTKEQSYRLEIPRGKLDPSKQYTIVVNCGINGATPKKVRSEYVDVNKAY